MSFRSEKVAPIKKWKQSNYNYFLMYMSEFTASVGAKTFNLFVKLFFHHLLRRATHFEEIRFPFNWIKPVRFQIDQIKK